MTKRWRSAAIQANQIRIELGGVENDAGNDKKSNEKRGPDV